MGTCHSVEGVIPSYPPGHLSGDDLLTRGIALVQKASIEKNIEKRSEILVTSKRYLREALLRGRFSETASYHIGAVLVALGEDPEEVRVFVETLLSENERESVESNSLGERKRRLSELALVESLTFNSPALDKQSPRAQATFAFSLDSPHQMENLEIFTQALILMDKLQKSLVSVRIVSPITGEEEMRFERILFEFGNTLDAFYTNLSFYLRYFFAYDLEMLEFLSLEDLGKVRKKPTLDKLSFIKWLSDAKDTLILSPLVFCPIPVPPPQEFPCFQPPLRLSEISPSNLFLEEQRDIKSIDSQIQIHIKAVGDIPPNKPLSISLTDQSDLSRTTFFQVELGYIVNIPIGLLRLHAVYDVYLVVDGSFRSSNRKTFSVLSDKDKISDDEDDLFEPIIILSS
jgi:hypothetical protein